MLRRNLLLRCPVGSAEPERYHVASRWLHWLSAAGMMSCVGLVLAAQKLYPPWDKCSKEQSAAKASLMHYHKSIGLTMLGVMIPRVAMRLLYPAPRRLPVSGTEGLLGSLSHAALYGMVIVLPVSGFVMGYAGGSGLPFFFTTIAPASGKIGKASNGELAGTAYTIHSTTGQALEFLLPMHIVAALGHQYVQGINIFTRMNPFV